MKGRLQHFKNTFQPSEILEKYYTEYFTEILTREGGEVHVFRVYGNEKDGYKIYER